MTRDCDLIFLDPDTGLPPGRRAENVGGEEYALLDEVLSLSRRDQSVVCVQFGGPGNFEREPEIARQRLAALSAALKAEGFPEPWGLWWRAGHKVGFLVAPAQPIRTRCGGAEMRFSSTQPGMGKSPRLSRSESIDYDYCRLVTTHVS